MTFREGEQCSDGMEKNLQGGMEKLLRGSQGFKKNNRFDIQSTIVN
jgi:hypothetical protein